MSIQTMVDKFCSDPKNMRLFQQEQLLGSLSQQIATLMERQNVSGAELARRIGKNKSFVYRMLRGSNINLRTLSDIYVALGRKFVIGDKKLGKH